MRHQHRQLEPWQGQLFHCCRAQSKTSLPLHAGASSNSSSPSPLPLRNQPPASSLLLFSTSAPAGREVVEEEQTQKKQLRASLPITGPNPSGISGGFGTRSAEFQAASGAAGKRPLSSSPLEMKSQQIRRTSYWRPPSSPRINRSNSGEISPLVLGISIIKLCECYRINRGS